MAVSASPGGARYTAAAELLVHGDSVAARTAAQLAVEWYQGAEGRLGAARYERLQFARALMLLGRYDEAVAALAFAPDTESDPHYLAVRGWIAAKQGRRATVEEVEARLATLKSPSLQLVVETSRARIAAGLGEHDRAIELLERSLERGMIRSAVGNDMHSDPLYRSLRGDPRFERINRGE
jgi:tetratricopeptide (TPR) repeat protein